MKAETERVISEREHRSLTSQYLLVQEEHRTLEKRLKKSIEKSKSVTLMCDCLMLVISVDHILRQDSVATLNYRYLSYLSHSNFYQILRP